MNLPCITNTWQQRRRLCLTWLTHSKTVTHVPTGAPVCSLYLLFLTSCCSTLCWRPETIQCNYCKLFFHMGYVQPLLNAKPMHGYGWTCGPCLHAHKQAVEGHNMQHVPLPTAKPKSHVLLVCGHRHLCKDCILAEKEKSISMCHFKIWHCQASAVWQSAFPNMKMPQKSKSHYPFPFPSPSLLSPHQLSQDSSSQLLFNGCISKTLQMSWLAKILMMSTRNEVYNLVHFHGCKPDKGGSSHSLPNNCLYSIDTPRHL